MMKNQYIFQNQINLQGKQLKNMNNKIHLKLKILKNIYKIKIKIMTLMKKI